MFAWCFQPKNHLFIFCMFLIENHFNVTHVGRNNYEEPLTSMENQGISLINTENMKVNDHTLVLIKNRLHH